MANHINFSCKQKNNVMVHAKLPKFNFWIPRIHKLAKTRYIMQEKQMEKVLILYNQLPMTENHLNYNYKSKNNVMELVKHLKFSFQMNKITLMNKKLLQQKNNAMENVILKNYEKYSCIYIFNIINNKIINILYFN